MPQKYTAAALVALDAEIKEAQRRHSEALLSMGDNSGHETWHDNPAFEQAKQNVDMTRGILNNLRNLRKDAVTVERETTHLVEVGSTLHILIDGDDELTTIHIAGHFVANRTADTDIFMLGTSSPMGSALLGKSEGDYVTYNAPSGRVLGATIVEFVD